MAKNDHGLWCFLLLCISCYCCVSEARVSSHISTAIIYVDTIPQKTIKKPISISDIYISQIGVREATGHNDGKDVEKYLRSVGLGKGYAWCAAFVRWCYDSANIYTSINGAAASAHNPKNLVLFHHKMIKVPQAGDAFTLWYPKLNRIGHTGFYHRKVNNTVYESYEGNTNEAGSREGDGVYKKYRSFNATYSISRWIKP